MALPRSPIAASWTRNWGAFNQLRGQFTQWAIVGWVVSRPMLGIGNFVVDILPWISGLEAKQKTNKN
jgi:hypothetical protein